MRTITDLVRPSVRQHREQAVAVRPAWQQGLIRWGWFIALWCAGVAGTTLLALPFKLIIASAK
ncbi:hypothetical protein [Pandoraea fibrosis]|uniref:DUF2474 domain-containing protein n=1 Tax=Pandoraea fibrosis TaxID=1891094 RepID=A0A5E4WVZ3_9BURK|nr:hypothetical protein [Pandoraea fibrosis]QHE93096.1 hypothetical protein PJ20_015630 [Pandoraea fibrosis]QHF13345.1 hypothetical protein PI93_012370 [Pandoraea fibrosis]VVE27999.1 hypothetical protein PFI31113_03456 [Pandoraea fibrosis]